MNSIWNSRFFLVICLIDATLFINLQNIAYATPSATKNDQRSSSSRGSSSLAATNNNNRKNVAVHKEVKNVNVSNEENTNISMKEKNKFNSQLAQIVINMPKQKVQRKSRRPTDEEKKLWFKIKSLYEQSKQNPDSDAFTHLGIVIDALNPKYIATYRLWKILNSDSISPYVPAEPLPNPLGSVEKFEFIGDKPIASQLDELASKLKELVLWNLETLEKLANTPDRELVPKEIVIKKALLCANNQHFCPEIETIFDETSKKLDARGVVAAIGHDPTKKRARPNLEKLIEEATGSDSDSDEDDEIEDPDEPKPLFPEPDDDDDDDEEEESEPPKAAKSRARKSNAKSLSKSPSMSKGSRSKSNNNPKRAKGHPKAPQIPADIPKPKSIAANHVGNDTPLSSESLMRLNRMRNSERFKSRLQFIRGATK